MNPLDLAEALLWVTLVSLLMSIVAHALAYKFSINRNADLPAQAGTPTTEKQSPQ